MRGFLKEIEKDFYGDIQSSKFDEISICVSRLGRYVQITKGYEKMFKFSDQLKLKFKIFKISTEWFFLLIQHSSMLRKVAPTRGTLRKTKIETSQEVEVEISVYPKIEISTSRYELQSLDVTIMNSHTFEIQTQEK